MNKQFVSTAAYLTISSYRGLSFGAQHYYGTITFHVYRVGEKRLDVQKKLSKQEAIALNKKDGYSGGYTSHHPGELTTRFDTEQSLVKYAQTLFSDTVQKQYPKIHFLVQGRTGIIEPQLVIAGDMCKEVTRINELAERLEGLHDDGGWDEHRSRMDKICDEWMKLAIGLGILHPDTR